MIKRPAWLGVLAMALVLTPLYYYLEPVFVRGVSPLNPVAVFATLPAIKLGAAALGPLVGVLVYRVTPISWYAILAYACYTTAANVFYVATGRMAPGVFAVFVPTGLLVLLFVVRREVRSPFFHPRLRRWEISRFPYRIRVVFTGDAKAAGETRDISDSGTLIVTDKRAALGDTLKLALEFEDGPVAVRAQVVRVEAEKQGKRGLGLRFDAGSAREVSAKLKSLRKRAKLGTSFTLFVQLPGRPAFECKTFDITRRGCFLVTPTSQERYPLGETLDMTLRGPEEPVRVTAEVVWVSDGSTHPEGIGLRFKSPPLTLQDQLEELAAVSLRPSERGALLGVRGSDDSDAQRS